MTRRLRRILLWRRARRYARLREHADIDRFLAAIRKATP